MQSNITSSPPHFQKPEAFLPTIHRKRTIAQIAKPSRIIPAQRRLINKIEVLRYPIDDDTLDAIIEFCIIRDFKPSVERHKHDTNPREFTNSQDE